MKLGPRRPLSVNTKRRCQSWTFLDGQDMDSDDSRQRSLEVPWWCSQLRSEGAKARGTLEDSELASEIRPNGLRRCQKAELRRSRVHSAALAPNWQRRV
jgi:hypothetical protein